MALPNFRQPVAGGPSGPVGGAQTMIAGTPVGFNILKERLRSSPSASPMGANKTDELRSNPFQAGQYSNPMFNPQKAGPKNNNNSNSNGVPKPPKAPEKPLMPYMRFSKKVWETVKAANPRAPLWEIGKIISKTWQEMAEEERQEYTEEYENEKQEYDKNMAMYKSTPAYQAYVQAKSRGNPVIEDPEPKGIRTAERRIDIQPAEDEEDPDDGLSVKHVAHARFTRNHRLINDILSENTVPDVRSVVTTARIQVLKRQLNSLTSHHEKFEAELAQIEETYNAKKKKFEESSEEFNKELKKHCVPAVDESKYKDMVIEQLEKLKTEREERARVGATTPPSPAVETEPADTRNILQPVDRGENPDSPSDSSSQASNDGREDSKDKDMRPSDGRKTNGSHEPPPQYADMAGQVPTSPGQPMFRPPSQSSPSPASNSSGTPPPGLTPPPQRGMTPPPNVTAPPPHAYPGPGGPPQPYFGQGCPPGPGAVGGPPQSTGGYRSGGPPGGFGGFSERYQQPPQGNYSQPGPYQQPPSPGPPQGGGPNPTGSSGPVAPGAVPVPANQGGSPPSSQRQPQKMDVKPVETGSKPGAPAATPTAPGMAPPSASAPTSAASPTPPTTKSS